MEGIYQANMWHINLLLNLEDWLLLSFLDHSKISIWFVRDSKTFFLKEQNNRTTNNENTDRNKRHNNIMDN